MSTTPPELERTLGKYIEPMVTDLERGVFVYQNTLSSELVMMVRDGTDWHPVVRRAGNDPVHILVMCRRLGVDVLT